MHFFISLAFLIELWHSEGAAYTQFLRAMQRDGSAIWATPSSVIMVACAGQTWAQGATGSYQCVQRVGCVAMLQPRSMKSTMIMLSPLGESHSRQAASQERQLMEHLVGEAFQVLDLIAARPGRHQEPVDARLLEASNII